MGRKKSVQGMKAHVMFCYKQGVYLHSHMEMYKRKYAKMTNTIKHQKWYFLETLYQNSSVKTDR